MAEYLLDETNVHVLLKPQGRSCAPSIEQPVRRLHGQRPPTKTVPPAGSELPQRDLPGTVRARYSRRGRPVPSRHAAASDELMLQYQARTAPTMRARQ